MVDEKIIHEIWEQYGIRTAAELAQRFKISRQYVYKIVEQGRKAGVNIPMHRKKTSYTEVFEKFKNRNPDKVVSK